MIVSGFCSECSEFVAFGHAFKCSQWTAKLDGPAPQHGPNPRQIQCESCDWYDMIFRFRDECSPCTTCGEKWPEVSVSQRRKRPTFRQQDHDESGPPTVGNWQLLGSERDLLSVIRTYADGQPIPRPLRVVKAA